MYVCNVCIYVCMYACMYVYVYIYTYVMCFARVCFVDVLNFWGASKRDSTNLRVGAIQFVCVRVCVLVSYTYESRLRICSLLCS